MYKEQVTLHVQVTDVCLKKKKKDWRPHQHLAGQDGKLALA